MSATSPKQALSAATIQRLLDLNRDFYATISAEFDLTRASIPQGMREGLALLDLPQYTPPMRVLDAGCGNGRLARALDDTGIAMHYVGLDADPALLAAARTQTADLTHVQATIVEGDLLAAPLLPASMPPMQFDIVACLAALHHIPSQRLRVQVLRSLVDVLDVRGALLLSTWQFLSSERLAGRVQPWDAIGLKTQDVEAGDYLLPWDQGVHALRYVHLIDEAEMAMLARASHLEVQHVFYADGKEGNLNLYAILVRAADTV